MGNSFNCGNFERDLCGVFFDEPNLNNSPIEPYPQRHIEPQEEEEKDEKDKDNNHKSMIADLQLMVMPNEENQIEAEKWLATKKIQEEEENIKELENIKNKILGKQPDDPYFIEILKNYGDIENYMQEIVKPLPENMSKINSKEGFSQILIKENKQKNQHVYAENNADELIEQTRTIWENFILDEEITEYNFEKIQIDFLKNVEELFKEKIELITKVGKSFNSYTEILTEIFKSYTTQAYVRINESLSSKDPCLLKKMGLYLNLIFYNNKILNKKKAFVGEEFGGSFVYRDIFIRKQLINLYKVNEFVLFTSLTSTSIKENREFQEESDGENINLRFAIQLLDLEIQKKNNFLTGVNIDSLSHYSFEREYLITPYQIFKVKKIEFFAGNSEQHDFYKIYLEEYDDKKKNNFSNPKAY